MRKGYTIKTNAYLLVLSQVCLDGHWNGVALQFASVQQLLQEEPVSLSPLNQVGWHFWRTAHPRLIKDRVYNPVAVYKGMQPPVQYSKFRVHSRVFMDLKKKSRQKKNSMGRSNGGDNSCVHCHVPTTNVYI